MATKMNENGVSTCKTGEKYEKFQMTVGRKRRTFYHYDYRDTADNELFSCVKPTLEECRRRCNEWLKKKRIRNNTGTRKVCRNARCTFFLVYHRYKSVYFLQAAIIRRFL